MGLARFPLAALIVSLGLAAPAQTIPLTLPLTPDETAAGVRVTDGLRRTVDLPRGPLREARRRMNNGEDLAPEELRALADRGDGRAAQLYVDALLDGAATPDPSDLAYYSGIAVGTGRMRHMPRMIGAMRALEPSDEPAERVQRLISVLYPQAWAGNARALEAVIAFNGEGRLFGALSDATATRIAEELAREDFARGALRSALILLETPPLSPEDRARARGHLIDAYATGNLPIRAVAMNMLALQGVDAEAALRRREAETETGTGTAADPETEASE